LTFSGEEPKLLPGLVNNQQNKTMEITKVTISKRASYEANAGRFVAEVEFKSDRANMHIPLSPDVSEKLLTFLTPVIVECASRSTNEIAEILTKQIADSKAPAIEA
jgi:hypothetical protein